MFKILYLLLILQLFQFLEISCEKILSERYNGKEKKINIVYYYYPSKNCTGLPFNAFYFNGCSTQGRVELNSTSIIFFDNKFNSEKYCDNFETITRVEKNNVCIDINDGSYIYKEYEEKDSEIINMEGSVSRSRFLSKDCSNYELTDVSIPNVCIKENDYFILFNISRDSSSVYKFKDSKCLHYFERVETPIENNTRECEDSFGIFQKVKYVFPKEKQTVKSSISKNETSKSGFFKKLFSH